MRRTEVNGRWPIILPDHRADFHEERPEWESVRLADMWDWVDWWPYNDGPSLIDVGSEEGDLTALYATWGFDVTFIDPSRPWRDQTLDTFTANGIDLPISFTGLADNYNYIEGVPVDEKRFATLDEKRVARITLDTFCEWFAVKPDAIMMDVEGSELRVLQGAEKVLEAFGPVVWVSVHPEFMANLGDSVEALFALMGRHGYEHEFLDRHHEVDYRFWRP